jgi:antitoxin component of MazEF toxin-antitoxin module
MTTRVTRIGNSRGIQIPRELLDLYGLSDGAELELEERREGILLRVKGRRPARLSWEDAFREMATDAAEREEWPDWDELPGDGLEG